MKKMQNQMIRGNLPVEEPLNFKSEIMRFQVNPLYPLIEYLGTDKLLRHGDIGSYYRAYDYYTLSLEKVLYDISLSRRFRKQVQPYYGGGRKFTLLQRTISCKYRNQRKFFEFDLTNYLIHTRILLDRTIGISRRFLSGTKLPSFSSFNGHKKFLRNHPDTFKETHPEYCNRIVHETDWFDMPVKAIRDKILVHNPPKHFLFLGAPNNHDLEMIFILEQESKIEQFKNAKWISFSARRIARDIEDFLFWFNSYALTAIRLY